MTRLALVACLIGLVACDFDRADQEPGTQINSCSLAADCNGGSECMGGLCVSPSSDAQLKIALLITPLPAEASEIPQPVLIEGLKAASGPMLGRIELPMPVLVSGRIRNGDVAVDAMLTFTPVQTLKGISAAAVTTSTTRGSARVDADYTVGLLSGREYSVVVRPVDGSLPPWHTTFTAAGRGEISVDFAELELYTQTYRLVAPADRTLLVQAFDAANKPISSRATVEDGEATLTFVSEPGPYRLEVRAEQSYDPMPQATMAEGAFCDDDTPVFPIYSIDASLLAATDSDGVIDLELPETPQRISYEGTIALCKPNTEANGDAVAPVVSELRELPVSLHSKSIEPLPSAYSASFDAHTTARLDEATGEFTFCVQLIEGNYDVVVTPPTSVPCGVFAERLTIDSPDQKAARGMLLKLPALATLHGTLQTLDEMPMAGATVDAVALGRVIPVEMNLDATTRYNRSRQTVTAEGGTFEVPVDFGGYDLIVKPPASSGFSWQVRHDVLVGAVGKFSDSMEVASPVMLGGRLEYDSTDAKDQAKLAGAEVLAYAIIADDTMGRGDVAVKSERAVPIGKVAADANGVFTLLLPQAITPAW